ncbi:MAG: sodium:calcium antiporter [Spirochaetaceae bacterium]
MYDPGWSLSVQTLVFLISGGGVAFVGVRLADYAARIARRTGLGQAVTGAIFLGATTSLSGIITSVTAAAAGHPELSASNAVGGIAAQSVFLAIADRVYQKANLEHAAASDENMLQGALLIALLAGTLLAAFSPEFTILGVHPVSLLILLAYGFGQRLVYTAKGQRMWQPRVTEYTQIEEESEGAPAGSGEEPMLVLWVKFSIAALGIGFFGYLLARTGVNVAERTGISETTLGGLFTAIATSFPELVTAIAAVRLGALTLAVSDIVGGNAFDVIFLAVADVAYREGSVYHAMGPRPTFLIMLTILLTSILLLGLIRREKHGIANIGFESFLLVIVYLGGFFLIVTTMS